jgi:hypothetical protein
MECFTHDANQVRILADFLSNRRKQFALFVQSATLNLCFAAIIRDKKEQ